MVDLISMTKLLQFMETRIDPSAWSVIKSFREDVLKFDCTQSQLFNYEDWIYAFDAKFTAAAVAVAAADAAEQQTLNVGSPSRVATNRIPPSRQTTKDKLPVVNELNESEEKREYTQGNQSTIIVGLLHQFNV